MFKYTDIYIYIYVPAPQKSAELAGNFDKITLRAYPLAEDKSSTDLRPPMDMGITRTIAILKLFFFHRVCLYMKNSC